jgi:hypothetical protein
MNLIERLHAATGEDFALNGRIHCALKLVGTGLISEVALTRPCDSEDDWFGSLARGQALPNYTGSIDAAAALIPDDLYWIAGYGKVKAPELFGGCAIYQPGDPENPIAEAEAATVPLAICLAVLKLKEGRP